MSSGAVAVPRVVGLGSTAVVESKAGVRDAVRSARREGKTIALVPTMGYLHEGHLSLLDQAREAADWVVLSIFVNPLQFGPAEDLGRYPRDLERDLAMASAREVDLVFTPGVGEMYATGGAEVTVAPGRLADRMCGASRPGHFEGVLTVVAKLFGIVQPDVAIFGQKDYQQATLIRRMVEDLDLPVEVKVAPIVREEDGLAMSSRNVYLTPEERVPALTLSKGLARCRALFEAGETDAEVLRESLRRTLLSAGVEPEYTDVVDGGSLEPVERAVSGVVCVVAARVGRTRLIDNTILP